MTKPMTDEEKKAHVLRRLRDLVWQESERGDDTPIPTCIFCGPDWGERHRPDCEYLLINPDAPVRESR